MTLLGAEVYNVDAAPVVARGTVFTDIELDDALSGPVAEILRDDRGISDLQQILSSVSITGFAQENLKRVLSGRLHIHSWRVGESLAETYLSQNHQCIFPWPTGRDVKNPNASPAGADLVGFQKMNGPENSYRFAFGEVKTSNESRWPPNVMSGRAGMVKQLESLRDLTPAKDALFRYLGYHAIHAAWSTIFRSAAIRYLNDSKDVSLFGMLVRDVEPKPEDLKNRATDLSRNCPFSTSVHLRGLYFPVGSIDSFAVKVKSKLENENGR